MFVSFQYARLFYISQWYRDVNCEVEKTVKAGGDADRSGDEDLTSEIIQNAERRKKFLLTQSDSTSKPGAPNFRYDLIFTCMSPALSRETYSDHCVRHLSFCLCVCLSGSHTRLKFL